MPTTLANIRTQIKAKLDGITGIGVVNDYERYAKSQSEFKGFYLDTDKILGWHIRRVNKKETRPYLGRWVIVNEWRLRGYMSIDDAAASEKTFDDLIESIGDAFKADDTLTGTIDTMVVNNDTGITLLKSQPVMLAGVLCHAAELQLYTRHYE